MVEGGKTALPVEALIRLAPQQDDDRGRRRWMWRMIAIGIAVCVLGLVVAVFGLPHHR